MTNTNAKMLLKEAGYTQTKIAWLLGVTVVSVNNVLSGKRENPRIREVIALAIGIQVSEIDWPKYAREGK